MNSKRYVFLALLMSLLILFMSPLALADLTIVETPPTDAGTLSVGDTLTLTFNVSYSGSTDSRAAISVGFNASGWTYAGFIATMDAVDVSAGFTESVLADSVSLTNDALEPDDGTLTVALNFTAEAEGNYTFDWSSAFSIISGTNPDIQTAMGTTNATVVIPVVTVVANAVWDEPTDTVDINATAKCDVCGTITSGTVTHEIFAVGDVSTGITGPMTYNAVTSRWEALDVDTGTLVDGDYYALVNVTDPAGHSGTGQAPFTITRVRTYTVTITTSGLSSPLYTTHIYVNGVDQGTPYLWDGQSRDFVFPEGENHTISVDQYVANGAGTRYHCEVNSWTTAPSENQTHTFIYITQYLLTLSTNFGTVSASPASPDGYYDAGTTVNITATPPSAIDDERYVWNGWTGTGNGSYTSLDNPASVTMNSPINETASWTHQYRLTVASEHGLPSPPVGDHWYIDGSEVTANVTSPADETDGTRYRCTGWTGTGSVPGSGTETTVTFTITEPSTITWNWITQYHLTVATNPSGLVPPPVVTPPDQWYDVDTVVTCTAQEVASYEFSHWTIDDVSQGADVNPITVAMDAPHTAIAHYTVVVPDFAIAVQPTTGTVVQGGSTTATVTVTSIAGYSENVTLSASGQPAGVSIGFNPESGTPTFMSSMNINVEEGVGPGSYTITITGTGADTTLHATTYELTVTALRPPVGGFRILSPLDTIKELAPWITLGLIAAAFIIISVKTRKRRV